MITLDGNVLLMMCFYNTFFRGRVSDDAFQRRVPNRGSRAALFESWIQMRGGGRGEGSLGVMSRRPCKQSVARKTLLQSPQFSKIAVEGKVKVFFTTFTVFPS